MRSFTLIMAYYRNASMLQRQYDHWRTLPEGLKECMQIILCDDVSPKKERIFPPEADLGIPLELYRLAGDKVPWNWLACRNVGAHKAANPWLLLTDMDHLVPAETISALLMGQLDEDVIYRFSRVDAPNLTPYKPHPNSWFMTAEMYDRVGGFDERFSGCYGSDYDFRNRCAATAKEVVMLEQVLVRYPRDVVPDASTTEFDRKNSEFSAKLPAARSRIATEGGRPLRLSFPYKRIA